METIIIGADFSFIGVLIIKIEKLKFELDKEVN